MKTLAYLTAMFLGFSLAFTGCSKREGPAERAGESLDRTGDKIHDALTPDGPGEKAGKKIDHAVDKATR